MKKIVVLGHYMPSKYSGSRIVSTSGIAPCVMECHGTVTAIQVKRSSYEHSSGSEEKEKFIFRKYRMFFEKNGYLPKAFNPYNCKEITNVVTTITTQCGSTTSSATTLIAEIINK